MARECLITTVDNPFDPVTQFDQWYQFDVSHGYRSCELLDRVAKVSNAYSQAEYNRGIENAIDDIINTLPDGKMWKKIVREVDDVLPTP